MRCCAACAAAARQTSCAPCQTTRGPNPAPGNLPAAGAVQLERVYESARKSLLAKGVSPHDADTRASQEAWCAVKRGYYKRGDRWVKRKRTLGRDEQPSGCTPRRGRKSNHDRTYRFVSSEGSDRGKAYTWSRAELEDTLFEGEQWGDAAWQRRIDALELGGTIRGEGGTLTRVANPRREMGPADPDACAMGKWLWDQPISDCGGDLPAEPTQAASTAAKNLATKGWAVRHGEQADLPAGQKRVAAKLLRNPQEILARRLARGVV